MSKQASWVACLTNKNIVANIPKPESIDCVQQWQQVIENEILNCENSIIIIDEACQSFEKKSLLNLRLKGNRLFWSAQNLESTDPTIQRLTEALCFCGEVDKQFEKYYLSKTK
ncbi:MAG: hypothetical protein AAFO04_22030 [Cyanobacteria bacterium J06592_8]